MVLTRPLESRGVTNITATDGSVNFMSNEGSSPVPKVIHLHLCGKNKQTLADQQPSHMISAHFDAETYRAFKALGAVQCKTTNGLLNEALALLFEKHRYEVPRAVRSKLNQLGIK